MSVSGQPVRYMPSAWGDIEPAFSVDEAMQAVYPYQYYASRNTTNTQAPLESFVACDYCQQLGRDFVGGCKSCGAPKAVSVWYERSHVYMDWGN